MSLIIQKEITEDLMSYPLIGLTLQTVRRLYLKLKMFFSGQRGRLSSLHNLTCCLGMNEERSFL